MLNDFNTNLFGSTAKNDGACVSLGLVRSTLEHKEPLVSNLKGKAKLLCYSFGHYTINFFLDFLSSVTFISLLKPFP